MRWLAPALLLIIVSAPASAENLNDALQRTYAGNPSLRGQRDEVRALDAEIGVQRARGLPNSAATFSIGREYERFGGLSDRHARFTEGIDLGIPIYSGGRVRAAIEAAKARRAAGEADLLALEGDIFTRAVTAYVDVIRDEAIEEANGEQTGIIERNLRASEARRREGDATDTDVMQSRARLAGAEGQLAFARARTIQSREDYRRITGGWPGSLDRPPPLPPLPEEPGEAVRIALAENASLKALGLATRAAARDVRAEQGERLPEIALVAGANYNDYLGTGGPLGAPRSEGTDIRLGVTLRLPLYQGGGPAARVSRARAFESRSIEQETAAERQVIADVRSAFSAYRAARARIAAQMTAVVANEDAAKGVRAGEQVGLYDILDILNADQELLDARILLIGAHRDEYVAGFALLNAMGQADARSLGIADAPAAEARPRLTYDLAGLWIDPPAVPSPRLDYDLASLDDDVTATGGLRALR